MNNVITVRRFVVARTLRLLAIPVFAFLAGSGVQAQQEFDFISGQNVQPAYEGWDRNPDGSFNLYFGYYNRNWEEEPNIPVGTSNFFSPGAEDQGQPTHFYPRRQMYLFKVPVPADFGNKELTWTVTHNGRSDKAVGWLAPFYEIDNTVLRSQRTGTQRESTPEEFQAAPPSIEAEGGTTASATTGEPLTLAALVTDDGLPGPRTRRFGGRAPASSHVFSTPRDRNATTQDKVSALNALETGLAVTFIHYRGPGRARFEPMTTSVDAQGGRAETRVMFNAPGTYVIRAVVDDQIFTAPVNITVTVTDARISRQ
jgi:hypothetical protein